MEGMHFPASKMTVPLMPFLDDTLPAEMICHGGIGDGQSVGSDGMVIGGSTKSGDDPLTTTDIDTVPVDPNIGVASMMSFDLGEFQFDDGKVRDDKVGAEQEVGI